MKQQKAKVEHHRAIDDYAVYLAESLRRQGVSLSVIGEHSLHVKGDLTAEQKETVRVWKQNLINALSPECQICTLPMRLVENNTLWFCPFGCQSLEVEKLR